MYVFESSRTCQSWLNHFYKPSLTELAFFECKIVILIASQDLSLHANERKVLVIKDVQYQILETVTKCVWFSPYWGKSIAYAKAENIGLPEDYLKVQPLLVGWGEMRTPITDREGQKKKKKKNGIGFVLRLYTKTDKTWCIELRLN